MDFSHPDVLWTFALLPLLLLLSFWRLRPLLHRVPSLELWMKIKERRPPVKSLKGPRWSLLLLLQTAACAAGILAAASPFLLVEEDRPRTIILCIDNSPSMGTSISDGGKTRFDAAKTEVDRLLSNCAKDDRVILLTRGSGDPERLQPSAARDIVKTLPIPLRTVDLRALYLRAQAVASGEENPVIVLVGDRDSTGAPEGESLVKMFFGGETANAGISACSAERKGNGRFDLFLSIFATAAGEATISCPSHFSKRIALAQGRNAFTLRDIELGGEGEISIDGKDDLPADNAVRYRRNPSGKTSVLMVGEENPFVTKALRSIEGVDVLLSKEEVVAGRYAMTLFNGVVPAELPEGFVLLINPSSEVFGYKLLSSVSGKNLSTLAHPLTANVRLEGAFLPSAKEIGGGDGAAKSLFLSDGKPVMILDESSARSVLILAFDPTLRESNGGGSWVIYPVGSFPIFWSNCVEYSRKRQGAAEYLFDGVLCEEESDNRGGWSLPSAGSELSLSSKATVRRDLTTLTAIVCLLLIVMVWWGEYKSR